MIKRANDFILVCKRCLEESQQRKEAYIGDTHLHAVAYGKGALVRFTCFRCRNVNEIQVQAPEPKTRAEVERQMDS